VSTDELPTTLVQLAVRNLLVDRLTADIVGRFEAEGIECILVKGPVIGDWLYDDAARGYSDTDLLVAPADWDRAVAVLVSEGFSDYLGPMDHPRMESFASTAFLRGSDNVDLHCTLSGLRAAPESVWEAFRTEAERQLVGGRTVAVPAHRAVLLHVALHAAAHPENPKPQEDLRRALGRADDRQWCDAAALAAELDGLAAFSTGLRCIPAGAALARRLGVADVSSIELDLRTAQVPTAEALHQLTKPGLTASQRARLVLSELFPGPSFMRWWSPVARRGPIGLVASYPLRWGWLAVKVPRGLIELRRVLRRRAE
jgi:hypothetical protein